MSPSTKVLLVEDSPGDARLAQEMLGATGSSMFAVTHVDRLSHALEQLKAATFDVVLLDLTLPDAHGLDTLSRIQMVRPGMPIVVLSGLDDEAIALEAVHRGAQDYLVKGAGHEQVIVRAIRYAIQRKQEHLRLAEALERAEVASRAKSDFLANMSHELRTPLNAIIGFSELMIRGTFGPIRQAAYSGYLQDIHGSAQHLLCIINDLLDLSRIEAGRYELQEELIDLAAVIRDCVRIVTPRAEESALTIEVVVPRDLPGIYADGRAIKQVLINLLANAVKFNRRGGRITVSAACETRGTTIVVEDTGLGMAPEDVPKALQPFAQIEGPLTRRFEGTGLGLPLSKRLVEAHGGRLDIHSQLGAGTKVVLTLPRARASHGAGADDQVA